MFLIGAHRRWHRASRQKFEFKSLGPEAVIWGERPLVIEGAKSQKQLLISGWWGLLRHAPYLGDILIALSLSIPSVVSHPWMVRERSPRGHLARARVELGLGLTVYARAYARSGIRISGVVDGVLGVSSIGGRAVLPRQERRDLEPLLCAGAVSLGAVPLLVAGLHTPRPPTPRHDTIESSNHQYGNASFACSYIESV